MYFSYIHHIYLLLPPLTPLNPTSFPTSYTLSSSFFNELLSPISAACMCTGWGYLLAHAQLTSGLLRTVIRPPLTAIKRHSSSAQDKAFLDLRSPRGILTGLILHGSWQGKHSHCRSVNAISMSCSEVSNFPRSFLFFYKF